VGFWGRLLRAILGQQVGQPAAGESSRAGAAQRRPSVAAVLTAQSLQAAHLLPVATVPVSGTVVGAVAAAGGRPRGSLALAARRDAQQRARQNERHRLREIRRADRLSRDITYLGRGVSGWLNERVSDVVKLQSAGLPVMSVPADVARALGISLQSLRGLAFHAEVAGLTNYLRFTVPKRGGGERELSVPHRRLAAAQRWILRTILDRLSVSEEAHGFVRGRSVLTNAQQHCGQAVVLNLDVQNFFPSIPFARVRRVFMGAGYSKCVATILALVCTECPRREVVFEGRRLWVATGIRGLPQGACTSPALSNLVCLRLDRRLRGLAGKLGFVYSRYADDLTFSGGADLRQRAGAVLKSVGAILGSEGLQVHPDKTRVQPRSTAQVVTGLVVNDRPGVCRREVRRVRAILHRAATEGLERQNRDGHPNFVAWLTGRIGWIGQSRPELGQKLLEELRGLR
jgi:retron-type reverse transcriptase